ncbi:enoyl-CoA hydratase/isomerase family protein [Nocardia sp. CA2R105]|uniref:enoyl-CoA hydratase-related protein n=1 Tax=Nocardia coffeae TaxID=2873381 RepID=UPI001CA7A855|nr:enoyl-CoA hydratase-related protein [Nocardia coffeae]MBY8863590.1 enoyl-CoA hydratase/isomerase family protein [Nocardia coffeae]
MTDPNSERLVLRDDTDGVAILRFNRPDRNNSWSVPMEKEYYRLLRECGDDPAVRVIIVTGAGRSFCPGMDTNTLADQAADPTLNTQPHKREPITTPRTIRKPVIAAINGACAGIGLIAAMNCDLRFLSSKAKVTCAFSQRGIMAEHGLAHAMTRVMGTSRALDLLFSSRIVMGQEAVELGLVDRVFEPDELLPRSLEYARGLAANSSPVAMGVMKQQVYEALETTQEEARTMAIRWWYDVLRDHGDFKEGVTSYLEKRPPAFAPWDPATPLVPAALPND